MIRDEAGIEDLMREAVSLVPRIECRYPVHADLVVLGLNNLNWLFVYPGGDTMYRFDEQGRLRRAFVAGQLFRTSGRTLAALVRTKDSTTSGPDSRSGTVLSRRELSFLEFDEFRRRTRETINWLRQGLNSATILRQQPHDLAQATALFGEHLNRVLESSEFLAPAIVHR